MVGDRWRDIGPATRPVVGRCGSITITPNTKAENPDIVVKSLAGSQSANLVRGETCRHLSELKVKLFADGAELKVIAEMNKQSLDQGIHHQPDPDAQGEHHRL
jgi:hypothetical protein